MLAAIQEAKIGQRLSFAWRVVAASHLEDDGWCVWAGIVKEVHRNEDELVSSLTVTYDLNCPELETPTQAFPPSPTLEDLTDRFEVKEIRLIGARRGLAQKRERDDTPSTPNPQAHPTQQVQSIQGTAPSQPGGAQQQVLDGILKGINSITTRLTRLESIEADDAQGQRRRPDLSSGLQGAQITPLSFLPGVHDPTLFRELVADSANLAKLRVLCPNFAVPQSIPDAHKLFYAQIWVEMMFQQPDITVLTFESTVATYVARMHPKPSMLGMTMVDSCTRIFVSYLRQLRQTPTTREDWMIGFHILHLLLFQLKVAEYRLDEVIEMKKKLEANPGSIDVAKALQGVKTKK